MKTEEINIRDPFVLLDNGVYYLYGTRGATAWTDANGFDVYVSEDLQNWSNPIEIFHRPDDFWATSNFWAPECIKYKDKYYFLATFGGVNRKKGIQILESDKPTGPFVPLTREPITPKEWQCLDGTIFLDRENTPWLVFSHSVPEVLRGAICAAKLSDDFMTMVSPPKVLFYADTAPWSVPIPFGKTEFGVNEDAYFSDGPYLFYNRENKLSMLWSSWGDKGYSMGISISASQNLDGPWIHQKTPVKTNGGHGMVFKDKTGRTLLAYHTPNENRKEHPAFEELLI